MLVEIIGKGERVVAHDYEGEETELLKRAEIKRSAIVAAF